MKFVVVALLALVGTALANTDCDPFPPPLPDYSYIPPDTYTMNAATAWMASYNSNCNLFAIELETFELSDACVDYATTLSVVTAVPVVMGIISLIAFWAHLCCRKKTMPYCVLQRQAVTKARVMMFISCIVVFLVCALQFLGSADIYTGIDLLDEGYTDLEKAVDEGKVDGGVLQDEARKLMVSAKPIADGACAVQGYPEAVIHTNYSRHDGGSVVKYANETVEDVDAAYDQIKVPKGIVLARSILEDFQTWLFPGVGIICFMYFSSIFFLVLGLFVKPKCMMYAGMIIGSIVVFLTSLFIGLEMAAGTALADICIPNPSDGFARALAAFGGEGDGVASDYVRDPAELSNFVFNCGIPNPFLDDINEVYMDLIRSQRNLCREYAFYPDNIRTTPAACKNAIAASHVDLKSMFDAFEKLYPPALQCKTFNIPGRKIIENGVCTQFTNGIATIVIVQVVSTAFLVIALFGTPIVLEVMKEHNDFLEMKKRHEDIENEDNRAQAAARIAMNDAKAAQKEAEAVEMQARAAEVEAEALEVEADAAEEEAEAAEKEAEKAEEEAREAAEQAAAEQRAHKQAQDAAIAAGATGAVAVAGEEDEEEKDQPAEEPEQPAEEK